uniref:General transcription factor II-I repeat domain-containing protein 2A n=1 Tax=Cacopsylla melanoneura TaxID=428564 RepID=A0A8D8YPU5_9HEMI
MDLITAFESKLNLWNRQLKNEDFTHFPCLAKSKTTESAMKFSAALVDIKLEFVSRFQDFRASGNVLKTFASPFTVDIDTVPGYLQLEVLEIKENSELMDIFNARNNTLIEFYSKFVTQEKYPLLRKNALRISSLFGSTYICEQLFSQMKITKSKIRTRLSDGHLENSLRIATTKLQPNIVKLVDAMQIMQCQPSHRILRFDPSQS